MDLHSVSVPPIDGEQAQAIARRVYGVVAQASPLPGEYDANFLLVHDDATRSVLKIMHPRREAAFVDLQCMALERAVERDRGLGLQRVMRTLRGNRFESTPLQNGDARLVFRLEYIDGATLAETRPRSEALLESLGEMLGRIDSALADFAHPAAFRGEFKWDLMNAAWISARLDAITDLGQRSLVERAIAQYHEFVTPIAARLRRSVIHNDANDYNVLVDSPRARSPRARTVIDWGDCVHTATVCELAIAAAYAMLDSDHVRAPDPLVVLSSLTRAYHRALPLLDLELAALFPLVTMRLAVSVVNSALSKSAKPGDPYVTISERPAWDALARLATIHPRFAHYVTRDACGLDAHPDSKRVTAWLERSGPFASPLPFDPKHDRFEVLDLSFGSTFLGSNPASYDAAVLEPKLESFLAERKAAVGVGRYDEPRPIYTVPMFALGEHPTAEHRTVHLGLDLFAPAGTEVRAPLDGVVHAIARNDAPQDYGPVLLLRHVTAEGIPFFTLYGHLGIDVVTRLRVGQRVERGERIASIGARDVNGGWPPHLHLQILLDPLQLDTNFPGVATPRLRSVWTSLCPDPNLLVGIPSNAFPRPTPTVEELSARRRAALGGNLSVSYERPLHIVRGFRQYLYDAEGRAYLDVYNNVPLVGHSHPRVVRAAQDQLGLLNTNTRYLHPRIIEYAERLTAKMPSPLRVCFVLNSASEANELALRLARAHTRARDVVVLEHAYHGHTTSLIEISPYKFDGPGGAGRAEWVHVAPIPDDYRGRHRRGELRLGARYAEHVREILATANEDGRRIAAFIAETMPSVGGQIVLPDGYLEAVYAHVRRAGGVCIADEVQVGFGRLGVAFFGFETQNVVPDIVVLGKPIGNGFPLAAVVTTDEIARSFANGMEFFSTFGGNPVACAAGLAVLDVLEDESLQANALRVGDELKTLLVDLAARHELIGDVRGLGLFLGIELVRDRRTREPASEEASYVVNRLRDLGILAGTDGPHHNVIKIRPPLVFTSQDARFFASTLDEILGENAVTSPCSAPSRR